MAHVVVLVAVSSDHGSSQKQMQRVSAFFSMKISRNCGG